MLFGLVPDGYSWLVPIVSGTPTGGAQVVNVVRYVSTVLWSFTGLGRRQDMAKVVEKGNPLALIGVGLLLATVLVGVLVTLATLAVSSLG